MARRPTPTLYVIAGPNGSGKSTLAQHLRPRTGTRAALWVNADELAAQMSISAPGKAGLALAAAIEADHLRHQALESRRDLITETVMSDAKRWVPFVLKARKLGYRITLYFVTTEDPVINIARIRTRVAMGGHNVPEDRVRSRYRKVMHEVLPQVFAVVDKAYIFDNSYIDKGLQLLAIMRDKEFVMREPARDSKLAGWLSSLWLRQQIH